MATIIKDAAPAARFRRSYDEVGRATKAVNDEGQALSARAAKASLETRSEEVDEL